MRHVSKLLAFIESDHAQYADTGALADLAWVMLEVALAPFSSAVADAAMLMVLLPLCVLAGIPGWVCAMKAAILCCDAAYTTRTANCDQEKYVERRDCD